MGKKKKSIKLKNILVLNTHFLIKKKEIIVPKLILTSYE